MQESRSHKHTQPDGEMKEKTILNILGEDTEIFAANKSDRDYVAGDGKKKGEEIQINLLLAEIIVQFYLIFHCF